MPQSRPLPEQLKNLAQVQDLDLQIDALQKKSQSLPANLKSLDQASHRLALSLVGLEQKKEEWLKAKRQSQAALDLNQDRMSRANAKLEGVQNSQEFQSANKEIEQLKKLNLSLEEQAKKAQEEVDLLQEKLSVMTAERETIVQERASQLGVLSGQEQKFNSDIDSLQVGRKTILGGIELRILKQYEKVRAARSGIGIVPALQGRCQGCNMMVPPQQFNEIKKGVILHSCPSCHRFLFIPDAAE